MKTFVAALHWMIACVLLAVSGRNELMEAEELL